MTQNRFEENAIRVYIKQIDQAINEMRNVFDADFTQDYPIQQGVKSEQMTLFRYIWQIIALPVQFSSREELDIYYEKINANLDYYIKDFYLEMRKEEQPIDKDKTRLFPIISLYHVLTKYKFILTQLEMKSQTSTFEEDITALKNVCSLSDFHLIDLSRAEKDIQLLGSLYQMLACKFTAIGYLNQDDGPGMLMEINPDPSCEEFKLLNNLLKKIPPMDLLCNTIIDLKASMNTADRTDIDSSHALLTSYAQQINDIETQLHQQLEVYLKKHEEFMLNMSLERDSIHKKIEIFNKQKDFFHMLTLLSEVIENDELKSAFVMAGRTGNQSSSTWWGTLTLGYWRNGTEKRVAEIFDSLDGPHKNLIRNYLGPLSDISPFLNSVTTLCTQLKKLNHFCPLFQEKLQNVNQLRKKVHEDMSTVQKKLNAHLALTEEESVQTYGLSFLGRHWGKMLIGLLSGGSSSVATSYLLSLEPAYFAAFCMTGTVLVGSVAAGAGVASDYFSNKNQENDDPDEVMLLPIIDKEEGDDLELLQLPIETHIVKIQQVLENNEKNSFPNKLTSSSGWWSLSSSLWKNAPTLQQTQNDELVSLPSKDLLKI